MTEKNIQTSSLTGAQALRIAAARAAYSAGIAVMPLLGCSKKPGRPRWQMAEFPDSAVTAEWARIANIGFRTGSVSKGLVVIDFDPGADITCLGELPDTVTVFTGRTDAVTGQRGMHLYFRTSCDLKNSVSKLCDFIDIRGDKGYVVAPGSTHPETGLQYEFKPGFGLGEIEIAELPQHLLDRIESKSKAEPVTKHDQALPWIEQVPLELRIEAGRIVVAAATPAVTGKGGHKATFKVACNLAIQCGLPYESALELMQEFNLKCTPQWALSELEHKCADAVKASADPPPNAVGAGLVSVASAVVKTLGVLVTQEGSELVLSKGSESERCRAGSSDKSVKRVFIALMKLLPEVSKSVLSAAAESFVADPPVAKDENHDADVFAIAAKRLSETAPIVQETAMDLAKDPNLIELIGEAYSVLGLVGLQDHCVMQYLAATSRISQKPIYVLSRGERCTGKSLLNTLTGRLIPPESVRSFSQITAKALLYLPEGSIKHRLIIAGERTHEAKDSLGEGTQILRELLSEGRASQFSVDGGDGGRVGVERVVEGPIGFIQSTTSENIFAEDLSRMYQVWLAPTDADRCAIATRLLRTSQGLDGSSDSAASIIQLHYCFQRMLKQYEVILPQLPIAQALLTVWKFDDIDHSRKVGALIELAKSVALLHQYQRQKDLKGRLIADESDIERAIGLMTRLNMMQDKATFGIDKFKQLSVLASEYKNDNFTPSQAAASMECDLRTARRRITRYCDSGMIRCTKESSGSNPAIFVVTKQGHLAAIDASQKAEAQ